MGQIYAGIESIARERAIATAKVEKIFSETKESVYDEAVLYAVSKVYNENVDTMTDEELDEIMNELPEDAADEKEEIARILGSEENQIDIDDILGIVDID